MPGKTTNFLLALLTGLTFFFHPFVLRAQSRKPALVVSPSSAVQPGTDKTIQLSLVNMGIPLKTVEIGVRFSGDMDTNQGLSFETASVQQRGLVYTSHSFSPFPGREDTQDLVVTFEATQPEGYNQGSSQVVLANITYGVVPGIYSAAIIPEKTRLVTSSGEPLSGIDTFGTSNYTARQIPTGPDISQYSLSFESDPIRKWWPTAPNSVQQIDAAIWKDSDGNNVKNFTNLSTEWQVDPNYLEIRNTSSSYFDRCPVPTVGNRPCIRFAAHVVTNQSGKSAVTVRVTDNQTGRQTWNSYPLEIYSLDVPPASPIVSSPPPAPSPAASFIPESQVSTKEFQEVQQKVTYLQNQLDRQQRQLSETQNLLERIIDFLKRIFGFTR